MGARLVLRHGGAARAVPHRARELRVPTRPRRGVHRGRRRGAVRRVLGPGAGGPAAGGWIGERITGPRRAFVAGGVLIALGHFVLLAPGIGIFWLGLLVIAAGTGLLKPNISTTRGLLYDEDDSRRDGGFSLFYFGINVGAFTAPIICGWIATSYSYRLAFSVAGIGMVLGLVHYAIGRGRLSDTGKAVPRPTTSGQRRTALVGGAGVLLVIAAVFAVAIGLLGFTAAVVSAVVTALVALVAVLAFWALLRRAKASPVRASAPQGLPAAVHRWRRVLRAVVAGGIHHHGVHPGLGAARRGVVHHAHQLAAVHQPRAGGHLRAGVRRAVDVARSPGAHHAHQGGHRHRGRGPELPRAGGPRLRCAGRPVVCARLGAAHLPHPHMGRAVHRAHRAVHHHRDLPARAHGAAAGPVVPGIRPGRGPGRPDGTARGAAGRRGLLPGVRGGGDRHRPGVPRPATPLVGVARAVPLRGADTLDRTGRGAAW
ncbi:MAG: peptide MFS transporter [Actinobacteria bacterium]|nr:peptide MFS transporter [Actinomycetota bacterium]